MRCLTNMPASARTRCAALRAAGAAPHPYCGPARAAVPGVSETRVVPATRRAGCAAGLETEIDQIVTPLHHHFCPRRLERVRAEMIRRGSPRIRAFLDTASRVWFALEGTHRLRAALSLGIHPTLISVRWPRSERALERARFAAILRGHAFPIVIVTRTEGELT